MSDCYLCGKEGQQHGIHGLDEIALCAACRNKFIYIRYLADPTSGSVLGFKCNACGFECDVPGVLVSTRDDKGDLGFEMKVDTQHNFCQSCGHSSRTLKH